MSKNKINNNKNNNKNKFRLSRRLRHSTRSGFKTYNFQILGDLVEWATPTYTEQNLRMDLQDLLFGNDTFSLLMNQYSQFRVNMIALKAIPRRVGGTDAPVIWIYLDINDTENFQYTSMPRLQGTKQPKITGQSTFKYKLRGVQTDFGYWHDASYTRDWSSSRLSLRIRSSNALDNHKHWQFQLKYFVSFRGFQVGSLPNNNKISGEDILNTKRIKEQQIEKPKINPKIITQMLNETEDFNSSTSNLDISSITSKTKNEEEEEKQRMQREIQLNNSKMLENLEKAVRNRIYIEGETKTIPDNVKPVTLTQTNKYRDPIVQKVVKQQHKQNIKIANELGIQKPSNKDEKEPDFEETFQIKKVESKDTATKIKHLENAIKQFQNSKKAKKFPELLFKAQQELQKLKDKIANELLEDEV